MHLIAEIPLVFSYFSGMTGGKHTNGQIDGRNWRVLRVTGNLVAASVVNGMPTTFDLFLDLHMYFIRVSLTVMELSFLEFFFSSFSAQRVLLNF